jgi:hypothetical protein
MVTVLNMKYAFLFNDMALLKLARCGITIFKHIHITIKKVTV